MFGEGAGFSTGPQPVMIQGSVARQPLPRKRRIISPREDYMMLGYTVAGSEVRSVQRASAD
jgi:hypothetical protein